MKLQFKGLSKSFEVNQPILSAMDFSDHVHALAIIGPSGGGKSTLLRILGGLLAPTEGQLWINDQHILFDAENIQHYRQKVGFVFQQGGLFKHMTALENIVIPLVKVHGYAPQDAQKEANMLLDRFGLLEDAHKKPSALSGGQQQRVAIARAIASKPDILFLDEPTSALDPEYTTEVLDIINELKEEGIDFVIVTHEMGFARHACEKVAFLCDGKLMEYGSSEQIFKAPQTMQLQKFLSKLLEWQV